MFRSLITCRKLNSYSNRVRVGFSSKPSVSLTAIRCFRKPVQVPETKDGKCPGDTVKSGINSGLDALKPILASGVDVVKGGVTSAYGFAKPRADLLAQKIADKIRYMQYYRILSDLIVQLELSKTSREVKKCLVWSSSPKTKAADNMYVANLLDDILIPGNTFPVITYDADGKFSSKNVNSLVSCDVHSFCAPVLKEVMIDLCPKNCQFIVSAERYPDAFDSQSEYNIKLTFKLTEY